MSPWLITAFLTGLISSLHCVGMCGPLVAALPIGRLPRQKRGLAIGLYHTGRVATYSTLGTLAGTMGLGLHMLGWQRPFGCSLRSCSAGWFCLAEWLGNGITLALVESLGNDYVWTPPASTRLGRFRRIGRPERPVTLRIYLCSAGWYPDHRYATGGGYVHAAIPEWVRFPPYWALMRWQFG